LEKENQSEDEGGALKNYKDFGGSNTYKKTHFSCRGGKKDRQGRRARRRGTQREKDGARNKGNDCCTGEWWKRRFLMRLDKKGE